jgi:hypothetical protein
LSLWHGGWPEISETLIGMPQIKKLSQNGLPSEY